MIAFSSLARIWGECLAIHFPTCAFFFFFFEVEISSRTLIPPSGQDQSTVAQRVKTTVDERSLTSCVYVRFPDGFPHMPGQHSQPTPTLL